VADNAIKKRRPAKKQALRSAYLFIAQFLQDANARVILEAVVEAHDVGMTSRLPQKLDFQIDLLALVWTRDSRLVDDFGGAGDVPDLASGLMHLVNTSKPALDKIKTV